MNKGFIKLSDGRIIVSNEYGEMKRRDFDSNAKIKEIMDIENQIEIIDNMQESINHEKNELQNRQERSIKTLLASLIGTAIGILGLMFSPTGAVVIPIIAKVLAVISPIIMVGSTVLAIDSKKLLDENERRFLTTVELKEISELRLKNAEEGQSSQEIKVNEPVSFDENIFVQKYNLYDYVVNETKPKQKTLLKK